MNDVGIQAFDLVAPTKTLIPMPDKCSVCGREKRLANLIPRLGGPKPQDEHQVCQDQIRKWEDRIEELKADPSIQAAYNRVEDALEAADALWLSKLSSLDIPDWIKEVNHFPNKEY